MFSIICVSVEGDLLNIADSECEKIEARKLVTVKEITISCDITVEISLESMLCCNWYHIKIVAMKIDQSSSKEARCSTVNLHSVFGFRNDEYELHCRIRFQIKIYALQV